MNALKPPAAFYSTKTQQWQEELEQLRIIVIDCGLTKALKRSVPCHTFQQINVVRFRSMAAQSKCPVVYYVNSSTSQYGFTPKQGTWTKIAIYWTNAGMKE